MKHLKVKDVELNPLKVLLEGCFLETCLNSNSKNATAVY
jgi:hypothetical protein